MAEYSRDYHDYVFRNGKLIAEFEAMYRESEGVPWHQDEQENWIDVRLATDLLQDLGPFEEIHDLGCGLGYYLDLMRRRLGTADCRGFGYDISGTACAKASLAFPELKFETLDLTSDAAERLPSADGGAVARRLFVIRATLWYVFPKIARVVQLIRSCMSTGDRLLVVQNFPPLDRPFVGKEVIPNHRALMDHFVAAFVCVRHLWYEETVKNANDNWFIGVFGVGGAPR